MKILLGVAFLGVNLLTFGKGNEDKIKEIEELRDLINGSKSELIEDLNTIPTEIFDQLQDILEEEYEDSDISKEELAFKIYDRSEAPSRGYRFKGENTNYRRFNFAVRQGNKWIISYHVSTGRLSYNNIVFLNTSKKKSNIKSYQISRGSHNVESLAEKLEDPDMIEVLYPGTDSSPFIIF